MSSYARMTDRLPMLYRPERGDPSLLGRYLATLAEALDSLGSDAAAVMQAHWVEESDLARYHPYFVLLRQRAGLPVLRPGQLLDLLDPHTLATALKADTPLANDLRLRFSSAMNAMLQSDQVSAEDLRRELLAALERIMRGPLIYQADRFVGISLSTELQAAVDEAGALGSAPELNRALLQAAFPSLLRPSQTNHPYLMDLARLGALLGIAPRWQPASLRESVEAYRLRLARIVAVYRNGLGTMIALRGMIEALLPVALDRAPELRDRPFLLETQPDLQGMIHAASTLGAPDQLVGPLMRWTLENQGVRPGRPTVYIQGVTPEPGLIDPTVNPMLERMPSLKLPLPLGITYTDTLAPDTCLRLRPTFASWVGTGNGVKRARSLPGALPANPTAPGPWNSVPELNSGQISAFCQGPDQVLWCAVNNLQDGTLWRYDGSSWTQALTSLVPFHCLAVDGYELLIGSATGLLRMHLFPAVEGDFSATPVAELGSQSIFALLRAESAWWVASDLGLTLWQRDQDKANAFGFHNDLGNVLPAYALHVDRSGYLYVGTERGLFQYQPEVDHWYYFVGGSHNEADGDWRRFEGVLPETGEVFLPPVLAVYRGEDVSLWLGTTAGVARYRARSVRGTTYETVLEAFPDLCLGRVPVIYGDDRGQVWFGSNQGLLRYDGRDWWQPRGDGWAQLGAAALRYDGRPRERGSWRFHLGKWESFGAADWAVDEPSLRTTNRAAVTAFIITEGVLGERGQWDGSSFSPTSTVAANKLKMRCKPTPDRCLDGGIPALPAVPQGSSRWRYLRYVSEADTPPELGPAWNAEGRLIAQAADEAPWEGRWSLPDPPPASVFDQAVFAFNPAARVWISFPHQEPLTVLARLGKYSDDERIDPAVIDLIWQGIEQVRPAGVRVLLAVEEELVRGL